MLPKAILFDLDDTIISFDGVTDIAWKETCDSFVKSEKTFFCAKQLFESIGKTRNWYWSDADRHRKGRMNMIKARREIVKMALTELQYFDEVKAYEMADNYSRLQEELICLFPNSIETLEKLKALGVRMALITNGSSEKQRGKINRFCLSEYFEFCLVEEEVGYGKPDIRVFVLALQILNLKAEEVWMVGDNLLWDIEAPKKVGIFSIWNDYKGKGLQPDSPIIPDKIISDISELLPPV
jgi:putative hydrolase of the HAD superfamily